MATILSRRTRTAATPAPRPAATAPPPLMKAAAPAAPAAGTAPKVAGGPGSGTYGMVHTEEKGWSYTPQATAAMAQMNPFAANNPYAWKKGYAPPQPTGDSGIKPNYTLPTGPVTSIKGVPLNEKWAGFLNAGISKVTAAKYTDKPWTYSGLNQNEAQAMWNYLYAQNYQGATGGVNPRMRDPQYNARLYRNAIRANRPLGEYRTQIFNMMAGGPKPTMPNPLG